MNETDAQKFNRLADEWETATAMEMDHPSFAQIYHPAYREILAMGETAVPLIFARWHMGRARGNWFPILRSITGADPVPSEDMGDVVRMQGAWLSWGQQQGIIE